MWSGADPSKVPESMPVAVRGADRPEAGEDIGRSNATLDDSEGQ